MSKTLELETWRKIFDLIRKNPGIDANQIAEELRMSLSYIENCLQTMKEKGEITSSYEGEFERYYISKTSIESNSDRRTEDTRISLYIIISKNPGLHLSRIAEMLNMSTSLAEYHLSYMEKKDFIISLKDEKGYFKRYYVKEGDVGAEDKKILALLRQEILLKIVFLFIKNESLKHKEILEKVEMAPSTLSYHLSKLVESGIIDIISYGAERGYRLKNEKEIIWIIRRYQLFKLIKGFKDAWKDFNLV
jgi:predicted transcriptional regulator